MKTIVPSYYSSFKCLAGACKNSCCIGWEIDIDDKTLAEYKKLPGDFGELLRSNIDFANEAAHFKLDASERCPFLNESGLCDIILKLGEDSICQICTDHPRFRNFFSDRTEIGLGLCCEACANIILSTREKVRLTVVNDDGPACALSEYEMTFLDFRDKIFDLMQDRSQTLDERVETMLSACASCLPEKTLAQWVDIFSSLEQLSPQWGFILNNIRNAKPCDFKYSFSEKINTAFEQFLVYLTYRHLWNAYDSGRLSAGACFIALSYKLLRDLLAYDKCNSPDYLAELCRLYSCEIEYSEDNMSALFDLLEG